MNVENTVIWRFYPPYRLAHVKTPAPISDTVQQYCQEKTYTPTSMAHYAYLYLPETVQWRIRVLYAFWHEISHILYNSSDAAVARLKLGWWQQEISKLYAISGQAEATMANLHPLAQALLPIVKEQALAERYFTYLIDSIEMDLRHHRYLDEHSFKQFLTLQYGAFAALVVQCLMPVTDLRPKHIRFAQALGLAMGYADKVCHLGNDAAQGRLYLPLDSLRDSGLTATNILNAQVSPALQQWLSAQQTQAKAAFQAAFAELPYATHQADYQRLRPCLIQAQLRWQRLCQVRADRIFQGPPQLSPLRKLSTATWQWWRPRPCC